MKKKNLLMTAIAIFGLATITMAQVPNYVPANGLVGWWPFNGNANDESVNGNNGTNNGATLTTDRNGLTNSSYSFSSDNQNITINGLYQNGISEYSVSGWFYKLSSTINQEGTLVSGATCDPSPIRTGLRVFAGNDDHLYYGAESQNCVNGVGTGTTSYFISDGIWHHFTAIFNSPIGNIQPTAFNIFIDGQLVNQNQFAQQINNLPTAPINNQGLSLIFGNSICSCDYFPGKLDDIGVWNRALTQQEITDLYNGCQLSVTSQTTNQNVNINSNAQFIVASSDPLATYQWQTDLGVGFQNLNNVGQYNGTTNDTLVIANVTLSNNNQPFRCIISSGSCSDTSNIAVLTVNNNVGINQTSQDNLFSVFPNPAQSVINVKAASRLVGEIYSIYDKAGKVVLTGKLNSENTTIELGNLSGGIYMFSVGENMKQTFKVIKE